MIDKGKLYIPMNIQPKIPYNNLPVVEYTTYSNVLFVYYYSY